MAKGGPAPSSDPQQPLIKFGFAVIVALIFSLALVLGKNSQAKTAKNMDARLTLSRQRLQLCETEKKMLNGELKADVTDEFRIAEDDHTALVSENQLLNEDNDHLREDNGALEKQIDDLREELDLKDYVSDEEVRNLEDTMAVAGNNTEELNELLEDYQLEGGINKDKLLEKLVSELKKKRQAFRKCKKEHDWMDPSVKKDWAELTKKEKASLLKPAVEQLAPMLLKNASKASVAIGAWIADHKGGKTDLLDALHKAVLTGEVDSDKKKTEPKKVKKPEEDKPKKAVEDKPKKVEAKKPAEDKSKLKKSDDKVKEEEDKVASEEDDQSQDESSSEGDILKEVEKAKEAERNAKKAQATEEEEPKKKKSTKVVEDDEPPKKKKSAKVIEEEEETEDEVPKKKKKKASSE